MRIGAMAQEQRQMVSAVHVVRNSEMGLVHQRVATVRKQTRLASETRQAVANSTLGHKTRERSFRIALAQFLHCVGA